MLLRPNHPDELAPTHPSCCGDVHETHFFPEPGPTVHSSFRLSPIGAPGPSPKAASVTARAASVA